MLQHSIESQSNNADPQLNDVELNSNTLEPNTLEPNTLELSTSEPSTSKPSTSEIRLSNRDTQKEIYGSFLIGDMEFAISVKAIQEVVNEPEEYQRMPLSPPYLLGLFNLRGWVVPVIDLRKIFEEENTPAPENRKIAIIEYKEYCVGILFDDTGEVFSDNDEYRGDFDTQGNTTREQIIKGVFKMDEGKRIVLILDPYEVLHLDKVPHSENHLSTHQQRKNLGKRKQCISFYVGDSLCAIDINAIQEIVNIDAIPNTALSSGHCLGAIDIRGTTVPIMNFGALLGCNTTAVNDHEPSEGYRVIIMKFESHLFGFMIDSVESIIGYFDHELIKFPILDSEKHNCFQGCIVKADTIDTILLNCEKILSGEDIEAITKVNRTLNREKAEHSTKEQQKQTKKTYITFSIDNEYAMDISEVKEVLDFPTDIIYPPDLPPIFKGMFNLRNELVAIVDPRQIYGDTQPTESPQALEKKLLIFSINSHKFGLIVDSVNAISSFNTEETMQLPVTGSSFFKPKPNTFGEQVHEVIRVTNTDQSQSNLQILKIESIMEKIELDLAS